MAGTVASDADASQLHQVVPAASVPLTLRNHCILVIKQDTRAHQIGRPLHRAPTLFTPSAAPTWPPKSCLGSLKCLDSQPPDKLRYHTSAFACELRRSRRICFWLPVYLNTTLTACRSKHYAQRSKTQPTSMHLVQKRCHGSSVGTSTLQSIFHRGGTG